MYELQTELAYAPEKQRKVILMLLGKRRPIRNPFIIICAVVALVVMAMRISDKGSFLVLNKAKEPISVCTVSVCGQAIELRDIQPNQSARGAYEVRSDSHFDIRIEFQSGKKMTSKVGYVTNGLDFHQEIVVTDSSIELLEVDPTD